MTLTIAIACDHAGYDLKEEIKKFLVSKSFKVIDLGTNSTESVDYPDYAVAIINNIKNKKADFGIGICGSGIGISIALNRDASVRAALCYNELAAELARCHNDANVLVLGSRMTPVDICKKIIDIFLHTEFEGGRHKKRVDKLNNINKGV